MSRHPMRVIKLGGSLLDEPQWVDRFRHWLNRQPAMPSVLIGGGGALVEAIRQFDRVHQLDPSHAHWLAIDAMSLTARLMHHLLPDAVWTVDWPQVADFADQAAQGLLIFDPSRFLRAIEPTAGGLPLPHGWDVTSDSIAARIGGLLACRELVLLKSCLPDESVVTLQDAAEAQYVDHFLPRFAAELPQVRIVNLRDDEAPEVCFRKQGISGIEMAGMV